MIDREEFDHHKKEILRARNAERIWSAMTAALLFAVGALIVMALFCPASADISVSRATIQRVIDGDTCVTRKGERIRLVGLQTPERGHKDFHKAGMLLANLVLKYKGQVHLTRYGKDRWNRTLGLITTRRGGCVNCVMREHFGSKKYDRLLSKTMRKDLEGYGWK